MALSELLLSRLDRVFNAHSVAIVGATDAPERVGYLLLESLVRGGFDGQIYPIHPHHKELLGVPVYPDLSAIPDGVDLALIALNQWKTVQTVRLCAEKQIPGVVCVAGGYKEIGEEGLQLERDLAKIAGEAQMVLVGPNTLGFFNADAGLNATFYPEVLPAGSGISVVTQSGGVGRAIIEELRDEGLGVSKWIGAGNRTTLEFADYVEYLARDEQTRVIVLFVEGTDRGRDLMETAGRIARQKPVIVLKSGRSEQAQKSAVTHTGSMIASPRLFSDACRQFGLIEAGSVSELVSAAKALVLSELPAGNRIGIITHTAGPSIGLLDELDGNGCCVPEFTDGTMDVLRDLFNDIPVIIKNPLDAAAFGYSPEGYGKVAEIVMADENVDLLVAMHALHKNWKFAVPQLIAAHQRYRKPVVACYISTQAGADEYRQALQTAGIPCCTSVEKAAWAISALVRHRRIRYGE